MASTPSLSGTQRNQQNAAPWIEPAEAFLKDAGKLAPCHDSAKQIVKDFAEFKSNLSTKLEKVCGCMFILERAARARTAWVYPPHIHLPAEYVVAYAVPADDKVEISPDALSYRALMRIPNRDSLYLQQPQILKGILGHISAETDPLTRVKGCARVATSTFRFNKPNIENPEKDVRLTQMEAAVIETVSSFEQLGMDIDDYKPLITVYNHSRLVLPHYEKALENQYTLGSGFLHEKDRKLLFEATLREANSASTIYSYAKRKLGKKAKQSNTRVPSPTGRPIGYAPY